VVAVSCYWSSEGNGGFQGLGYTSSSGENLRVRFMRNSATGMVAIVLGETTTSWSYPNVSVTKMSAHYGIASDSYADGWTATITTSLAGLINSDDVPNTSALPQAGSSNYIQNQLSGEQTSSDFWISGTGRLDLLKFNGEGGNSGVGSQNYAIYQEDGAWSTPYPDLVIAFHTGIKIGGYYGYNGTRFYNDAPERSGATEIFSVGNGDNDVRVLYNLNVSGKQYMNTSLGQASAAHGISWYRPDYTTWYDYMAPGGATNAPSGTAAPTDAIAGVTSWARRFNIENSSTYGWLFESGLQGAGNAPTVKFAINASTGNVHSTGTVFAGDYARMGSNITAGYYQDVTNGAYRAIVGSGTTNGYYFQTNAGAATNMYVGLGGTYNGRVGIGTTTPGAKLDIPGTGSSPLLKLSDVTVSSVSGGDLVIRNLGQLRFQDGNDWDWNKWGGIKYVSSANTMYIGGPASGQFTSNASPPSINVVFDGINNVGIGLTNPTYKLHVNGAIRTLAINETSDVRMKKDISDISNSLEKILEMRGVTYNWRQEEFPESDFENGLQYGLIAQELEKIVPELVETDSEGWKSIEYSHLVPLLIESIKEQQTIIDSQRLHIEESDSRIDEVSNQMVQLKDALKSLQIEVNTGNLKAQVND